ncbi:MAG: hypothetical protein ABSC48_15065 [Terracidiphilus sp.]
MEALRRFALFEIGIESVRNSLAGVFEFDFQPERRTAATHFRVPAPGVLITRAQIEKALESRRAGLVSPKELMEWATFILLNDGYEIDEDDQDFIAECLNELSFNPNASL